MGSEIIIVTTMIHVSHPLWHHNDLHFLWIEIYSGSLLAHGSLYTLL